MGRSFKKFSASRALSSLSSSWSFAVIGILIFFICETTSVSLEQDITLSEKEMSILAKVRK